MSILAKTIGPRIVFIACFATVVMGYYLSAPLAVSAKSELQSMVPALVAASLLIGLINVFQLHGRKIEKRAPDYPYSILTLVIVVAMIALGQGLGLGSPAYTFVFNRWYSPLYASFYSFQAVYGFSAVFRTLRLRKAEYLLTLMSFTIVMLNTAPATAALFPGLAPIASWIWNVPNAAGVRALVFGAAIGLSSLTVRIIMGREKAPLGITE